MDLRNLKIEDVAAAGGITPLTQPPLKRVRPIFSDDMPTIEAVGEAISAVLTILNSAGVALTRLGHREVNGSIKGHVGVAWTSAYDALQMIEREAR